MKAKRLAVFDSNESDLTVTASALRECYDQMGQKVSVRGFSDVGGFIRDFRDNHYDMAFIAVNGMRDVGCGMWRLSGTPGGWIGIVRFFGQR